MTTFACLAAFFGAYMCGAVIGYVMGSWRVRADLRKGK